MKADGFVINSLQDSNHIELRSENNETWITGIPCCYLLYAESVAAVTKCAPRQVL